MSTLLQLMIGALTGLAWGGSLSRWRRALAGAAIGCLPDIDTVVLLVQGPLAAEAFRYGPTHSLVFAVLLAPAIGWLLSRGQPQSRRTWTRLSFAVLLGHIALDGLSIRGAAWFFPFWASPMSLAVLPDFAWTLAAIVLAGGTVAWVKKGKWGERIAGGSLFGVAVFIIFAITHKLTANALFENAYHRQGVSVFRFSTFPAPGTTRLWLGIGEDYTGYQAGYLTVANPAVQPVFAEIPSNIRLLADSFGEGVQKLNPYFALERKGDTLKVHDVRYGFEAAWLPGHTQLCRSWKRNRQTRWQEQLRAPGLGVFLSDTYQSRIRGDSLIWKTPPAPVVKSAPATNKSQQKHPF